MADAIETLLIKIAADVGEFVGGMNQAVAEANTAGSRIGRAFTNVGNNLNNLGRGMRRFGAGLSVGLTAPILLFARQAVIAWNESEQAIAQVEARLASTGEAAGRSLQQLQDQAMALSNASLFDDDDILRDVTANLLRFPEITEDVFDRAQRDIIDFAEAMDKDLSAASNVIARALADPIQGMTSLGRAGVELSDEQQAAIRRLVEAGDLRAAQIRLLEELEIAYGNSAAKAAQTGLGPLQQLEIRWGNITEEIGGLVMDVLPPLIEALRRMVDWFGSLSEDTKRWVVQIALLAAAVGPVLIVLGSLLSIIGQLSIAVGLLWGTAAGPWGLAIAAVVALGAAVWHFRDDIWGAITSAWAKVTEFVTWLAEGFPSFFLDAFTAAMEAFWSFLGQLSEGLAGIPDVVNSFSGQMLAAGAAFIQSLWDGMKQLMEDMKNWIVSKIQEIIDWILGIPGRIKDAFVGVFDGAPSGPAAAPHPFAPGGGGLLEAEEGARAAGGPVPAGGTALVGEHGPELLKMGGRGGTVVPHGQSGKQGQTGGITGAAISLAGSIGEHFAGLVETILSPIAALEQLIGAFQSTYEQLVGHSIVPDMETEILDWFLRTNAEVVASTEEATDLVAKAYAAAAASAKDAMNQMFSDVKKIGAALFGDSKAWAIAEIIMNTAQAVMKALATYPPPFSYAAAATAAAAGMAQLASVKSTSKGGGSVAGVGGLSGESQASSQMQQTIFVQGINMNQFYQGDQVRELANALLQHQKDGGKVVWKET